MNNLYYILLAYSFIWLVFGFLFYSNGKKVKELEEKLKDIENDR